MAFNREDIIDAYAAYAWTNKAMFDRIRGTRAWNRSELPNNHYGSVWTIPSELEPSAVKHYFALIAKLEGAEVAAKHASNWARIQDKGGVTIRLENSDDDPTRITFIIQDEIADAWCDNHGSLDGGTWECADGPDFCYDFGTWRPGLIESLRAEGYDLDCSVYNDPDEEQIATMAHACECEKCDYQYDRAIAHIGG